MLFVALLAKLNNRYTRRQGLPKLRIVQKPLPQILENFVGFDEIIFLIDVFFFILYNVSSILLLGHRLDLESHIKNLLYHFSTELHIVYNLNRFYTHQSILNNLLNHYFSSHHSQLVKLIYTLIGICRFNF